MNSYSPIGPLSACFLALLGGGCQGAAGTHYTHSRIADAEVRVVFAAAEATMNEFFNIDESSPATGVIRSAPAEEPVPAGERLLGTSLSSPRLQRRVAEIRVRSQGGAVGVDCAVRIQRAEPAGRLSFVRRESTDDAPNQTPLQESEGLTEQGHVVWSTVSQDRRMERQILAALEERLAGLR